MENKKSSNKAQLWSIIICFLFIIAFIFIGMFKLPNMMKEANKDIKNAQLQVLRDHEKYTNDNFHIIGDYKSHKTSDDDYAYIEVETTNGKIVDFNAKYEEVPNKGTILVHKKNKTVFCFLIDGTKNCSLGKYKIKIDSL